MIRHHDTSVNLSLGGRYSDRNQDVYEIRDFIEFKTTWHPIGV